MDILITQRSYMCVGGFGIAPASKLNNPVSYFSTLCHMAAIRSTELRDGAKTEQLKKMHSVALKSGE